RGEYLGLVDVVDSQRLQDLRLDEVPDARLGHHRDRNGLDDAVDQIGIAHPRNATLRSDVGGYALQRHHRDRTRVFGDLRLLGIDDVHDDAALEHLGHAAFHARGSDVVRGFGLCSEIGHGRPQLFAGWMKLLPSYGGGLALPTRRSPLRGADVWRATRSRVAP